MSESKTVDKLKYLEKYLAPKEKKKSKKSKHSSGHRLRILDDDVDLKQLPSVQKKAESEDEEAPIVASVVDDRPLHVKVAEQYTSTQWKSLGARQEGHEERSRSSKQSPSKTKSSRTSESSHKGRHRHDSDSDLSPERHLSSGHHKTQKRHEDSPGAPQSKRHDSDSDLSPERQRSSAHHKPGKPSGATSPQEDSRRTKRQDSGSDLSPPRNRGSDDDLSPPRKRGFDSDLSPARRRGSDSDLSPPRKTTRRGDPSPPSRKKESHKSHRKTDKTSPKERVKVKKEKEEEKVMEVVKLRDDSKALKAKADAAKEEEKKKIYSRWGKGVAQQEQHEKQLEEQLYEMSKPFSRYEGDADLEKHLKEQDREGDPMLKYIKKKKASATENNRPRYNGPEPPPNRFGIWPGYRWDGVDRSNGFEKRLVEQKNSAKANEEEAYKWSVEDM